MRSLDYSIVPNDTDYGGLRHLRAHVVFVPEPTVNELTKYFLTKRPMIPCGLADHVAAVEISKTRIGKRLRLIGSSFDMHRVSERIIEHIAFPFLS